MKNEAEAVKAMFNVKYDTDDKHIKEQLKKIKIAMKIAEQKELEAERQCRLAQRSNNEY